MPAPDNAAVVASVGADATLARVPAPEKLTARVGPGAAVCVSAPEPDSAATPEAVSTAVVASVPVPESATAFWSAGADATAVSDPDPASVAVSE